MPVINLKFNPPDPEISPSIRASGKGRQFVSPLTKAHAKKLTLARFGNWDEGKARGRNAVCFECGAYDMAVTPKQRVGVVMCCNACGAGKRDGLLFEAAIKAGFECGPGPDRQRRPDLSKLLPASEAALAGLKRAEKRVLVFCAKQTATRDWFEVPGRSIIATCRLSWRDVTPLLKRLAERGLIRVRSNNYAAKRPTQVAFLVDPVDLVQRLDLVQRFKAAA